MGRARRAWLLFASCVVLGCSTDVGDQACTEKSVATDKDDGCPYGPPGGPRVTEGGCPNVVVEGDPTACTVSWEGDVFPLFKDPAIGNCSADGCHGPVARQGGIYLPAGDPAASYVELKDYLNSELAPYVSDEAPEEAWILCNLTATIGGGEPMPPKSGLTDATALAVIERWVTCGMKPGGPAGGGGGGP
jgi:hypothetical protein